MTAPTLAAQPTARVLMTSPEFLHIGDELLTDDGWQKVLGVYLGDAVEGFGGPDELVTVFTPERNIESDGWQLDPENAVQIRRTHRGPCAIEFVEVIR